MGIIFFLRLPWATGQAGLSGILGGIGLAELMALPTVLSISAIATNGNMDGGGAYFMISRSLGPELGGAIGFLFYLAYATGTSSTNVEEAHTHSLARTHARTHAHIHIYLKIFLSLSLRACERAGGRAGVRAGGRACVNRLLFSGTLLLRGVLMAHSAEYAQCHVNIQSIYVYV